MWFKYPILGTVNEDEVCLEQALQLTLKISPIAQIPESLFDTILEVFDTQQRVWKLIPGTLVIGYDPGRTMSKRKRTLPKVRADLHYQLRL
jgi:hypothetical protein